MFVVQIKFSNANVTFNDGTQLQFTPWHDAIPTVARLRLHFNLFLHHPTYRIPIHIDHFRLKCLAIHRLVKHSPCYPTKHRRLAQSFHLKTRLTGIRDLRDADEDSPVNGASSYLTCSWWERDNLRSEPNDRSDTPCFPARQKTMSADGPYDPVGPSRLPFMSCVVRHL